MNYKLIFRVLSAIIAAIIIGFLICLITEKAFGKSSDPLVYKGWWMAMGLAAFLAITFFILSRKCHYVLFRRDAYAILGLGWILTCLLGALPFWFILPNTNYTSAFFEATSGFTTTGASIFAYPENLPKSLLSWRAITQFMGGIGIVVFFLAILKDLGVGAKSLYSREFSGVSTDFTFGSIQSAISRIAILYFCLNALAIIALHITGMNWFDAICHGFAAIATGGLSNYSDSIGHFSNPATQWVTIFCMIAGATNFIIFLQLIDFRFKLTFQNTELRLFLSLIFACSAYTTYALLSENQFREFEPALRAAVFQITTFATTTGFYTVDYDSWNCASHVLLIGIMIIGGCSGSTAGGLKSIRVAIAIKTIKQQIEKNFRPRLISIIHINKNPIPENKEFSALTFIVMAGILYFILLIAISMLHPEISFKGNMTALFNCMCNVGLSFSEAGPTKNFDFYSPTAKILLSIGMLLGRLEFYALISLFFPSLWKQE